MDERFQKKKKNGGKFGKKEYLRRRKEKGDWMERGR